MDCFLYGYLVIVSPSDSAAGTSRQQNGAVDAAEHSKLRSVVRGSPAVTKKHIRRVEVTPAARPREKRTMAKRQKTGKTLALFDVDGTLTVPRKVRRGRREGAFSRVHETTPRRDWRIGRDRPPPRARRRP